MKPYSETVSLFRCFKICDKRNLQNSTLPSDEKYVNLLWKKDVYKKFGHVTSLVNHNVWSIVL